MIVYVFRWIKTMRHMKDHLPWLRLEKLHVLCHTVTDNLGNASRKLKKKNNYVVRHSKFSVEYYDVGSSMQRSRDPWPA